MIKAEDQTLKATDLRIGNWINVYGIDDQAIDIMCDGVNTKSYPCMTYENISGIELNEEWLIKLGFEKSGIYWFKDRVYIYEWGIINVSYHNESIMTEDDDRVLKIEFTSVHQLQNYFYALTGTELTTKP